MRSHQVAVKTWAQRLHGRRAHDSIASDLTAPVAAPAARTATGGPGAMVGLRRRAARLWSGKPRRAAQLGLIAAVLANLVTITAPPVAVDAAGGTFGTPSA